MCTTAAAEAESIKTVYKVLKQHTFDPFKIYLVQDLNEDDPHRRLQICEVIEHLITTRQN